MKTNTANAIRCYIPLSSFLENELNRLASMQLSNGALPMWPLLPGHSGRICPYFSSFAALALLAGSSRYYENVRQYIEWHFAHLNTTGTDCNSLDGTIYDYTIQESDGVLTETPVYDKNGKPTYDSTDSYAALFLMVLVQYRHKTGDIGLLLRHADEIQRVIHAMLGTLDQDLTYAKPDFPIKYTMDNCEVAAGLASAVRLSRFIPMLDGQFLRGTLQRLSQALETCLWNRNQGYYEVGVDHIGAPVTSAFSWQQFYPDAMAQAFPILMGIQAEDSGRAQYLYRELYENYPPDALSGNMLNNASMLALTAARMGDTDTAQKYLDIHQKSFCETEQPNALTCQGYALGALAAATLQSSYEDIAGCNRIYEITKWNRQESPN